MVPVVLQAFPDPPHSLGVSEDEVFAQRFRTGRIPSPWCAMNILLYCYVIHAQGLELKAPSLHALITGSSVWTLSHQLGLYADV